MVCCRFLQCVLQQLGRSPEKLYEKTQPQKVLLYLISIKEELATNNLDKEQ